MPSPSRPAATAQLPEGRQVECILNRVCIGAAGRQAESETIGQAQGGCADCEGVAPFAEMEAAHRKSLQLVKLRPLAVVPCSVDLAAPRVLDVAQALKARVVFAGEIRTRRVSDVGLCAANVPNALRAMRPGALIITPGDRSDIMMAAALSVQCGHAAGRPPAHGRPSTPTRGSSACAARPSTRGCPCWRSTSRATARPPTWRA